MLTIQRFESMSLGHHMTLSSLSLALNKISNESGTDVTRPLMGDPEAPETFRHPIVIKSLKKHEKQQQTYPPQTISTRFTFNQTAFQYQDIQGLSEMYPATLSGNFCGGNL